MNNINFKFGIMIYFLNFINNLNIQTNQSLLLVLPERLVLSGDDDQVSIFQVELVISIKAECAVLVHNVQ